MLITWDGEQLHRAAIRGVSVELMEALGHETHYATTQGVANRLLRGENFIYTADITPGPEFCALAARADPWRGSEVLAVTSLCRSVKTTGCSVLSGCIGER